MSNYSFVNLVVVFTFVFESLICIRCVVVLCYELGLGQHQNKGDSFMITRARSGVESVVRLLQ